MTLATVKYVFNQRELQFFIKCTMRTWILELYKLFEDNHKSTINIFQSLNLFYSF